MSTASNRHNRSQLYALLAAAHAGPLGYSFVGHIRKSASGLLERNDLPEVLPAPKAEAFARSYSFCAGCKELGCGPDRPSRCLPEKFGHLAYSSSKGATERRRKEAAYIREELLPCLETVMAQVDTKAYQSLLALSWRIARADAQCIDENPAAY